MPEKPKISPAVKDAANKAMLAVGAYWGGQGDFDTARMLVEQAVQGAVNQMKEMVKKACKDDPMWDNTPGEHPAFGRGQDNGVRGAAASIEKVLEKGQVIGVSTSKELQVVRERVAEVLQALRYVRDRVQEYRHVSPSPDSEQLAMVVYAKANSLLVGVPREEGSDYGKTMRERLRERMGKSGPFEE